MVFLHKVQAVAVLACIHSELDFCFNVDPARRVSTRWHYDCRTGSIKGWAVVMMHERAAAAAWIWLIDWKKSNFFFDFPAQRHRFIKGFFAVVACCRACAEASATEICPNTGAQHLLASIAFGVRVTARWLRKNQCARPCAIHGSRFVRYCPHLLLKDPATVSQSNAATPPLSAVPRRRRRGDLRGFHAVCAML